MKYLGSKARIAKDIIPFLEVFPKNFEYHEPFVGGANVIDKIGYKYRFGYDSNAYLIELLSYVARGGKLPETISEEDYNNTKQHGHLYPAWYVGLVGFCGSYGGKWFAGYPRGKTDKGVNRDYTNESIRNLEKQRNHIKGIIFKSTSFDKLDFKNKDAVIYADPPYEGTTNYKDKFNSSLFWSWCVAQSRINPVFISEYRAPGDFVAIWDKPVLSNLSVNTTKKSVEKLFIHKAWSFMF